MIYQLTILTVSIVNWYIWLEYLPVLTFSTVERKLSEQDQEHRKQVDQVRRDLTQQQEALPTLRRDMTMLVEQQVREVLTALEQMARDQAHDVATLIERLEKTEQRIEQVATRAEAAQITAASYQKRAD